MSTLNTCPSCGSKRFRPLRDFETENLSKCAECTLVFCTIVPTEKELRDHYNQYGRDDYHSPVTINRYRELLLEFEPFRSSNKILDIGCGIGFFLEEAGKMNWEIYGTEFTEEAVKMNREKGISMFSGSVEDIDFGDLTFDVITSFEVLEHLQNPKEHLEKIASLLRPGGLLYLTTPNFNALHRKILKKDWNVISYPEHLCYFSKQSLDHLLKNHGFKKSRLLTQGISPERLIRSRRKEVMDYSTPERTDESIRQSIDGNRALMLAKDIVNWKLNLFNLGDTLKAWYVKL